MTEPIGGRPGHFSRAMWRTFGTERCTRLTVAASLEACDFQIRSQVIWAKPSLVIGRGHYHWQHEPCWYAVRTTGHWNG